MVKAVKNNFSLLKKLFTILSLVLWLCSSFLLFGLGSWSSFFIIVLLAFLFQLIGVSAAFKDGEFSVDK